MTGKSLETSANNPSSSPASAPTTGAPKPIERGETRALGGQALQEGAPTQESFPLSGKAETPSKPSETWWLKHLKEHPFKALSLAVSVYGGLILLVFFVQLGSMPELDLAGATATLAAVAVIGLLVVSAMGAATIAAGVATRSLALDVPHLTHKWSLVTLVAPGGIFIAVVAVSAALDAEKFHAAYWLWSTLALSFLVPLGGCWNQLRLQKKSAVQLGASPQGAVPDTVSTSSGSATAEDGRAGRWWDYVVYPMSGFVWFFSALMAFLTYEALARYGNGDSVEFGVGLAIWGVASVVLNVMVVKVPPKIQWHAFIALGGASVLILTMLTSTWSAIPVAVVRTLGLGEVPVGVVVTAEGCDTFNKAARGQKVCQMDADQKLGWVCPAILKSRIGAPMVFELASFGDNGSWPISPSEIETKGLGASVSHLRYQRIQVAKSEVKSWPSITPFPRQKKSKPTQAGDTASTQSAGIEGEAGGDRKKTSSRPLVSYLDQSVASGNKDQQQWLVAQCGEVSKGEVVTAPKPVAAQTQKKSNPDKSS